MSQRTRDLLNEGNEDEEGEDLKSRLEALEKSTGKIEEMLGKLCKKLNDRGETVSISVEDGG